MAERKELDWAAIANNPNEMKKRATAADELERVGADFMISDALSHKMEAGHFVLQCINGNINGRPAPAKRGALAAAQRQYKLRVLMDKWGEPVKPGDKVEWKRGQDLRNHVTGNKITAADIKELIRRGELRTIQDWGEAEVDGDLCITVDFADAAQLLDTRGVHYNSDAPITGMREKSSEPAECRDGVIRTQHFWLYEEVPPGEVAETGNEEE